MDDKRLTSQLINNDYRIGTIDRRVVDALNRIQYLETKSVRTMRWMLILFLFNIIFTIGLIYGIVFCYNGY